MKTKLHTMLIALFILSLSQFSMARFDNSPTNNDNVIINDFNNFSMVEFNTKTQNRFRIGYTSEYTGDTISFLLSYAVPSVEKDKGEIGNSSLTMISNDFSLEITTKQGQLFFNKNELNVFSSEDSKYSSINLNDKNKASIEPLIVNIFNNEILYDLSNFLISKRINSLSNKSLDSCAAAVQELNSAIWNYNELVNPWNNNSPPPTDLQVQDALMGITFALGIVNLHCDSDSLGAEEN